MLKKLLLTAIFALPIFANLFAQQLGPDGSPATNPVNLRVASSSVPFRIAASGDSARPLSELNTVAAADAYPFLSADGLRLYCIENGIAYSMYSRASVADSFANKKATGISISSGAQGIWLSLDELSAYYCANGSLYHVSRTDTSQLFGNPSTVSYSGGVGYGLSLTPDSSQLYLYQYSIGLSMYKKTGSLSYTYQGTINAGTATISGPSQLSKDGLTMFVTIATSGGSEIAYMTRSSLDSNFSGTPTLLDTVINNTKVSAYTSQPSVSADGDVIIYVTSNGTWAGDDLYQAEGVNLPASSVLVTAVANATASTLFSLYPNPSAGMFNIQLNCNGNNTVTVSNAVGTVVKTANLSGTLTPVDMGNATSGIYYVTVTGDAGSATQKLVVQ